MNGGPSPKQLIIFLESLFKNVYVYVCNVYLCPCRSVSRRGQKRTFDFLELELHVVREPHTRLTNSTVVPLEEQPSALNC